MQAQVDKNMNATSEIIWPYCVVSWAQISGVQLKRELNNPCFMRKIPTYVAKGLVV